MIREVVEVVHLTTMSPLGWLAKLDGLRQRYPQAAVQLEGKVYMDRASTDQEKRIELYNLKLGIENLERKLVSLRKRHDEYL